MRPHVPFRVTLCQEKAMLNLQKVKGPKKNDTFHCQINKSILLCNMLYKFNVVYNLFNKQLLLQNSVQPFMHLFNTSGSQYVTTLLRSHLKLRTFRQRLWIVLFKCTFIKRYLAAWFWVILKTTISDIFNLYDFSPYLSISKEFLL